jgi:putative ATP-binding cassette transporter
MAQPISTIMGALPSLRQSMIALKRIEQLDDTLLAERAPCGETNFTGNAPLTLELRGVCHQYPGATEDRAFVLGPIDFTIHAGELLFIVGGNGSGKTTLAMLLLGLYPPESGAIYLNGHKVTEANVADYRQHFSAVFADFHLFEQLLEMESDALMEKTNHYLASLEMANKVQVVDGKFSTLNLSTGQRKRLALISSYLEDRPIYLFDEWAADQDPAFKRVFYTELLPELKARGKTVIVITHDDAYFSCADRVIKLQDGALKPFYDEPAAAGAQPHAARPPVRAGMANGGTTLEACTDSSPSA